MMRTIAKTLFAMSLILLVAIGIGCFLFMERQRDVAVAVCRGSKGHELERVRGSLVDMGYELSARPNGFLGWRDSHVGGSICCIDTDNSIVTNTHAVDANELHPSVCDR